MKTILFSLFCLLMSANVFAVDSVTAYGKILFKNAEGDLVKKNVTLTVPAQGEGEIVLDCGDHINKTTKFWTRKKHDRVVFYVLFKNPVGLPNAKYLLLKGTYERGNNLAVYYGDYFIRPSGNDDEEDDEGGEEILNRFHLMKYAGGFFVKSDIY